MKKLVDPMNSLLFRYLLEGKISHESCSWIQVKNSAGVDDQCTTPRIVFLWGIDPQVEAASFRTVKPGEVVEPWSRK